VLRDLAAWIGFSQRGHTGRRQHFILNEFAAGVTLHYGGGRDRLRSLLRAVGQIPSIASPRSFRGRAIIVTRLLG
jgi:hypothetical protein